MVPKRCSSGGLLGECWVNAFGQCGHWNSVGSIFSLSTDVIWKNGSVWWSSKYNIKYRVLIPRRLHHLPWLPSINRSMIAVLQNGRQALICPNYSDLSGSTAPKSLLFSFSNLLFQALVFGTMGRMSWPRKIHNSRSFCSEHMMAESDAEEKLAALWSSSLSHNLPLVDGAPPPPSHNTTTGCKCCK